jgi:hypothetical protein
MCGADDAFCLRTDGKNEDAMKKIVGSLSLSILLLPAIVDASPITFGFTGVVSQDPLLDPDDPFGGSIAFGTLFSGSYVFESTTPDGDPSASGGSYTSAGGMLSITIGGNAFIASDFLNIGVGNNFSGSDFYTVFARNTSGADPFDLSLTLQDLQGSGLRRRTAADRRAIVRCIRACDALLHWDRWGKSGAD